MTAETTVSRDPAAPPSMIRDLTVREDAAVLRVSDLTVREAAAVLRVSERTVARWAATGHIRAWRGGRAWRIPATEITRIRGEA